MSDNRPIAYQEGRTSIYRGSSVGACETALVAAKLGHEEARSEYASNILTSAAREGNMHEGSIIDTLVNEYGWRVDGSQDLMELQVIPHVIIRGHVDGLCKPKGMRKQRLLEVKTMSDSVFKQWMRYGDNATERLSTDRFAKYAWQISAYMAHYNLPAMYVVKNRNSGVLDISEIKTPIISFKEIRAKILRVERTWKRGVLPDCGATSDDQFFCPYPYLHENSSPFGDEPISEPDPVNDATEALLEGMAEHYHDLAKQTGLLKPLDDERKDVGKKIVDTMGGRDTPKKRVVGQWQISRTDSSTNRTDNDAVAVALGVDLERYEAILKSCKKKYEFSYVKVTKIGDK